MKKFLALVIVLTVAVMAWLGSRSPSPSHIVETKIITEENVTGRYTLNVEYPKFVGGTQLDFINTDIEESVATTVAAFIAQAKETTVWAMKNNVPGVGLEEGGSLYIRYEVATGTPALIPVRLLVEEYDAGAAHPRHTVITRNYDLKTQKILDLADLFSDSNYLEQISKYVQPALIKKFEDENVSADVEWITMGTEPKAENYESWLATSDGLQIIFNEYQVAPYAYGIPEILIPWTALQNLKK